MRILITGSSSGIGNAVWRHLCAEGHEVWGVARSDPREALARMPVASKSRAKATVCDVTDWLELCRAADEVKTAWGGLDALICAAGTQGAIGLAMENDVDSWVKTVQTNLTGTYLTIRCFFPLLSTSNRKAKILCFSGGGAAKARIRFSAYACAKAGIVRLVETLSEEWKTERVDINAVAPGAVYSRMTEEVLLRGPGEAGDDEWAQACRTRDAGPEAMARVCGLIDYLLTEQTDGITGKLISAQWDPWERLHEFEPDLRSSDIYCLRRIVPKDRGQRWGDR